MHASSDVGEHRKGGADEIDTTNELVRTSVNVDAKDLQRRNVEGVDAAALACLGKAAADALEKIAVWLVLTTCLVAQELPQLGFGVGTARFHDEIG